MDYSIAILDSDKDIKETAEQHIVYAVDGSCTLLLAHETVQIERSGIYLLNFREPARLEVPRGALTALLSIDYFALCGLYNRPQIRFTVSGSNQRYDELRSRIQSLLLAYAGGGTANVCRELGEFYLLLQLLLNHFQIPSSSTDATEEDGMNRLFSLLHSDPRMDLTLNDLAAKMFLSPAAASRLFRKATGENFTEYRKRTRLDYVKKELETTQKSITKIAVEIGFTSSSVFNRVFREEYGVTPSQYREQYRQAGPAEQVEEKNLEKVRRILENDRKTFSLSNVMTEQVRAKSGMHIPWKRWENKILNVGPIYFLQAANMQEHMLMLAERLDVEYIRVWNIFAPRLMIQKDSGGNYNFSFLDEILDFCVDHKLKLHLDLAQRRNVSLASEKSEIYSLDEFVELNWVDTLAAFLGHIKRRYTEEVVSQWIFEMTFFLNDRPYYEGAASLDVWRRGYSLIKSALPKAKVAGPGVIPTVRQKYTEKTILDFINCDMPPDIFTSLNYPYEQEGNLEDETIYQKQYQKLAKRDFLREQINFVRKVLDEHHYSGEYWVTDWGVSLANRNYLQDSCFRGASILENVLENHERVGAMGIFFASDLLSVYADSSSVLSGSSGLLSRHGIRKPAYYAFRFLHQLGRYQLAKTAHCIVTENGVGDIHILCFNSKGLGPKYYLVEENAHRPQKLDGLYSDLEPLWIDLVLEGMTAESYHVRQRILNPGKGSVLDKWIALDCMENLTRGDLEYLERTAVPEMVMEKIRSVSGEIRLKFRMEPNEMRMIMITA